MDVTDAILKRRSIRNFKPDPVEKEKIEKVLEAVNQGLTTCCVGAISPKAANEVMGIPDNICVHDLILLGYPGEDPKIRPRKDFEEIVFWEEYK